MKRWQEVGIIVGLSIAGAILGVAAPIVIGLSIRGLVELVGIAWQALFGWL